MYGCDFDKDGYLHTQLCIRSKVRIAAGKCPLSRYLRFLMCELVMMTRGALTRLCLPVEADGGRGLMCT